MRTVDINTLKQYLDLGIKLIPAYDNGALLKPGNPRDLETNDINEIQSLIKGNGYRNGIGKWRKINLFRFFPIDYGLVVIDIDRHKKEDAKLEEDGLKNWLKIEAKLNLPQDCELENHACYVRTPSNDYHLYFKLEDKAAFKTDITDAVEILYNKKAVNVAGSKKEGKVYYLVGSLDAIPILPESLLKEMIVEKPPKREPQTIKDNHSYIDGDQDPSTQIRKKSLRWLRCYTSGEKYKIWAIAERLNNNAKAGMADVVNTLGRI